MITINAGLLDTEGLPSSMLLIALLGKQDETCRSRLNKLHEYAHTRHAISGRQRLRGLPNNRLPHDLPGYIVTVSSGYLVGEPVQYAKADAADQLAFDTLNAALKMCDTASVDAELAVDAAVYGKGVELCYADRDAQPKVAQVDPRSAFVVYDDTVEHLPLLGIVRYEMVDQQLAKKGERVDVYTPALCVHMERAGAEVPHEVSREPHYFGAVPMIEYWNNAQETGDFEPVLDLIDAYDTLQSDRLNDKQQFTDAIMVFKGLASLENDSDDPALEDGTDSETDTTVVPTLTPAERLRQTKMLFMPGQDTDATFLTKPDAESGNELLRKSLAGDIHKFSYVPDLTDENFAGTTSGVAMRFKLFGLEMLVNTKERWFREALRTRLKCMIQFLAKKGMARINVDDVQITFTRSLPVNELEIAQMASAYQGILPDELILAKIPGVDDPKATLAMLQQQKAEDVKRQQAMFPRFDASNAPAEDPQTGTTDEEV